ncbi:ATP-dependent DNA ligase [Candidatus Dojkabacteria bacterium]|nr:ATP-dependent DNA ligase [Candidatus Dojkabacteria bacterium]
MKFTQFVQYLERLEKITSRNEITEILAELFAKVEKEEIKEVVYLTLGRLVPKFVSLEFNVSSRLFIKGLSGLNNKVFENPAQSNRVQELYSQEGDVGAVASHMVRKMKQKGDDLEIKQVYEKLKIIAELEGEGSQGAKIEKIQNLLNKCSPNEAKFIGRIIIGKLRLGVSEKTVLDALSWFEVGDKSLRSEIERAYGVRSDIGYIADIVKGYSGEELINELSKLKIEPGIPVASKLVEREKSVEAVFERMEGSCLVQPKLDGLRAQIHYKKFNNKKGNAKKSDVQIFSRNMENTTHMFPDLVRFVKSNLNNSINSFVLDSEVIAYDPESGHLLEFQKTIQRKRKHDVKEKSKEIPIKAMVFDLLYIDGKDISRNKLEKRIQKLDNLCQKFENPPNDTEHLIEMLDSTKVDNEDSLNVYFEDRVGEGLEGVIVKKFKTPYEPGTRNFDWIKLKASIKDDMIDELDGVVLGYYHGKGIRSKFGIGAILVGIYNEKCNQFETVAKVGTGITDDEFVTIKKDLMRITIKNKPKNYEIGNNLKPDIYVEPEIVVVVEADEITRSKMHTACKDDQGRGLSMRFPRLKIWNRQDKDVEQTTSPKELEDMFNLKNK